MTFLLIGGVEFTHDSLLEVSGFITNLHERQDLMVLAPKK